MCILYIAKESIYVAFLERHLGKCSFIGRLLDQELSVVQKWLNWDASLNGDPLLSGALQRRDTLDRNCMKSTRRILDNLVAH